MVDRLRRSLEDLEPPTCEDCHVEMAWYHSVLVSAHTVAHFFQCPNCSRMREMRSTVCGGSQAPGPTKLSRSRCGFPHAA